MENEVNDLRNLAKNIRRNLNPDALAAELESIADRYVTYKKNKDDDNSMTISRLVALILLAKPGVLPGEVDVMCESMCTSPCEDCEDDCCDDCDKTYYQSVEEDELYEIFTDEDYQKFQLWF